MTDQEAYVAGIEKLGLWHSYDLFEPSDLRTDPAFAWRVLNECWLMRMPDLQADVIDWMAEQSGGLANALYAAVVKLGREK